MAVAAEPVPALPPEVRLAALERRQAAAPPEQEAAVVLLAALQRRQAPPEPEQEAAKALWPATAPVLEALSLEEAASLAAPSREEVQPEDLEEEEQAAAPLPPEVLAP